MVTSKGEKKGFSKYNNPAVVTFKSTRDTDFYSTLCIMNGYGLRVHRAPDVIFITAAFFFNQVTVPVVSIKVKVS